MFPEPVSIYIIVHIDQLSGFPEIPKFVYTKTNRWSALLIRKFMFPIVSASLGTELVKKLNSGIIRRGIINNLEEGIILR